MNKFLKGMDISSLTETELLNGRYYDDGQCNDLFTILKLNNINAIRLRLWNDPYDENGQSYLGGYCDETNIIKLAKRAQRKGMALLLDFHYSDFWADPGKQFKPKAWTNLTSQALEEAIYQYTKNTLSNFKNNGVLPQYIQVGNEITNGMLWPDGQLIEINPALPRQGYDNLAKLLSAAIKAIKEIAPSSKIMIHLERSGDQKVYDEWLNHIINIEKVKFDILGVSYYPYWHGCLETFANNMKMVKQKYQLPLMIVETSYAFSDQDYEKMRDDRTPLVINKATFSNLNATPPFPLTMMGQSQFIASLLKVVDELNIGGVFYWEPGWLPLKGSSWASLNGIKYIKENKQMGNEWANQGLFNYDGHSLPALKIIKNYIFKGELK